MCLSLEGSSYLAARHNAAYEFGVGDFTLEAWVRPTVAGPVITSKPAQGGAGNGGFLLNLNPAGGITFATDDGSGYYLVNSSASTTVLDGQWHHLAGVRRSGQLSVLLDGQVVSTTVASTIPPPANVTNSCRLMIGSSEQQQEPYNQYSGLIDEVRVWSVARSADDIAVGMTRQADPATPGLVGYYSFESGSLADQSPTNNPLAVTGMGHFTTRSAPIAAVPDTLHFLAYRGAYATQLSRDSGATWTAAATARFMGTDQLVLSDRTVPGLVIKGNSLSWPVELPQPSVPSGSLTVKVDSPSASYWPTAPPSIPFFEGTLAIPSGSGGPSPVMWRGAISADVSPCRFLWNWAAGLVVDPGNAKAGVPLTLQELKPGEHQHFCLTTDGYLMHMVSGLVAQAAGADGGSVVLQPPSGQDAQRWSLPAGAIRSIAFPQTALAASATSAGSTVVTAPLSDPPTTAETFSLLGDPQTLWNGAGGVLDTAGHAVSAGTPLTAGPVGTVAVATQGWHLTPSGQLLCAANGMAATASSLAEGAAVTLQPAQAGSPAQAFTIANNGIAVASNTDLMLDATDGTLHLQPAGRSTAQVWAPHASAAEVFAGRAGDAAARGSTPAGTVNYEITVKTGDKWFAGTDDPVSVRLSSNLDLGSSPNGSTDWLALTNSLTHGDPFEQGNEDRFVIAAPDAGTFNVLEVQAGEIPYTLDYWYVEWIRVFDPTRLRTYTFTFNSWMDRLTVATGPTVEVSTGTTLGAGCYPSDMPGVLRRIKDLEHSWVTMEATPIGAINFGCAGGYQGDRLGNHPGARTNIVTVTATPEDAVRMATGQNPPLPLQNVYGYDDSAAVGNAGITPVVMFSHWDGQCHQIANRLLYSGSPRTTLGDAQTPPGSYGLSVMLFGVYGVNFEKWCAQAGFTPPLMTHGQLIAEWVRRVVSVGLMAGAGLYMWAAILALQEKWINTADGEPAGSIVGAYVKELYDLKLDNTTIGRLTGLDQTVIQRDEL